MRLVASQLATSQTHCAPLECRFEFAFSNLLLILGIDSLTFTVANRRQGLCIVGRATRARYVSFAPDSVQR